MSFFFFLLQKRKNDGERVFLFLFSFLVFWVLLHPALFRQMIFVRTPQSSFSFLSFSSFLFLSFPFLSLLGPIPLSFLPSFSFLPSSHLSSLFSLELGVRVEGTTVNGTHQPEIPPCHVSLSSLFLSLSSLLSLLFSLSFFVFFSLFSLPLSLKEKEN